MFKTIKYEEIDKNKIDSNHILIDLRSQSEYESETIPGSISLPLFNDEERRLIGTIYVQESVEKAKKIGVETASKRLPFIYEEVALLDKKYHNLIFFCARGGFRSSSLVSLFMTLGINAFKLDGGYKGYRKYINESLPELVKEVNFVVLYGNTGAGKTNILKNLQEEGMDILDLEGCANHRGSLLGSVGLGHQNTQKMFESLVYESLKHRKSNIVFVEGESKRIGRILIPEYLYDAINHGINIRINTKMEDRINNIMRDYVHETDEEIISSLELLRNNLGNKNVDQYINMVKNHEYKEVIKELMLKYYDPLYEYKNHNYAATFENDNSQDTAKEIIEWIKNI